VTHDGAEAAMIAEEAIVLKGGRIVERETT